MPRCGQHHRSVWDENEDGRQYFTGWESCDEEVVFTTLSDEDDAVTFDEFIKKHPIFTEWSEDFDCLEEDDD